MNTPHADYAERTDYADLYVNAACFFLGFSMGIGFVFLLGALLG